MATVEKPFFSLSASTSANVCSGVRFEALTTKPALLLFTRRTISASLSMDCEPKMNESPPSLASATASVSFDTDCMIAETIGIFRLMGQSSCPLRYLTSGVLSETRSGTHSSAV